MKKATRRWPANPAAGPGSMHLLDPGEQPAARAVDRLGQVPDLREALRAAVGRLAHPAGKAHARPVPVALGGHLDELGVERHDVGLLARLAALARELGE